MSKWRMLIGGELQKAASGKTYPVINPATGEEFDRIPIGGEVEVEKAIAAARRAFPEWSQKPIQERAEALQKIGAALRERHEEIAMHDCLDHGTPITVARNYTMEASCDFDRAAAVGQSLASDALDMGNDGLAYVHRKPVGVCALITPWNVPLWVAASKIGSALIMGNTCVLKPPSIDSITSLILGEIIASLSDIIPPGVVNIITGTGEVAGNALASHSDIDMVSFTGSTEAGKSIFTAAGKTVKKLCLELGGKNPFIVMADANIDIAAAIGAQTQTENTGQACISPGRYLVHETVYEEFIEKYVTEVTKVVVGDPLSLNTTMGPVVGDHHRNSIEAHIKSAVDEGAKLTLGQLGPLPKPLDKGYYVLPTVITGVTPKMKVYREEIFGPVACITRYCDNDDVIAMANDNNYGLAASVWTRDIEKGMKAANAIEAGTIWVNTHMGMWGLPMGGNKESGVGKEEPEAYCDKNSIYVQFG
jgi:acyl-CoA reductase-like NAD-dependent aldehyde dehydrogenase